MNIQRSSAATFTGEYGGITRSFGVEDGAGFRRLYPWAGIVDSMPWGSGLMVVAPGTTSKPHAHHEHETFFIVSGRAECRIGDEVQTVSKGDVIYVPLDKEHELINRSPSEPFEYLCIWWPAEVTA